MKFGLLVVTGVWILPFSLSLSVFMALEFDVFSLFIKCVP